MSECSMNKKDNFALLTRMGVALESSKDRELWNAAIPVMLDLENWVRRDVKTSGWEPIIDGNRRKICIKIFPEIHSGFYSERPTIDVVLGEYVLVMKNDADFYKFAVEMENQAKAVRASNKAEEARFDALNAIKRMKDSQCDSMQDKRMDMLFMVLYWTAFTMLAMCLLEAFTK